MELTASGDAGEKSLAMKRILKNIINLGSAVCYFDADGKEITKGKLRGDVSGLTGDVSGLRGDVSGLLRGDVSGLRGDVSWLLRGDVSGLTGDVSGLTGDVNECEITAEDREKGVSISDLVSD